MKQLLFLCLLFYPLFCYSQTDTVINKSIDINTQSDTGKPITQPVIIKSSTSIATPTQQPKKPELFNSGFIDFQNSGQMNASARVFKIYIGEPQKFMLPISVYSGVSGNNYNTGNNINQRGSEQMILGLINPMSGVFNLSTDNTFRFKRKPKSLTNFSFVYQLGEKMITGQQAFTFKTFSFFSTYANSGLLFQTGAWEKDKEKNMGVFWLLFRYHIVNTSNTFQKLSEIGRASCRERVYSSV